MPQTTIYAAPRTREQTPPPAVATHELARLFGRSAALAGVTMRVEAGRTIAAALYATLAGDAAFRADLEAVRAELQQVLAASETRPDAGTCEVEAAAAAAALP